MDASPTLARVARLLEKHGLETVLIGNAAAALQGAPVTTVDLDFLFRKTPANLKKLKAMAAELEAVILKSLLPGERTVSDRPRQRRSAARFHVRNRRRSFL